MPCNNRNNLTLAWSAHHLLLFSVYQTEIPGSDFYEIRLLKTWISAIKISPRRKIINCSLTLCRPQFDARQLLSTHLCLSFFYLLLTIYGKWGPSPSAQAAVFRPNAWKSFFWVVRRPSPFSPSQADSISIIITSVIIITNHAGHHYYRHLLSTLLSLPPPPHGSYNRSKKYVKFKDFSQTVFKYSVNWHSLTPFWTPYWLNHSIWAFTIFLSLALVDHLLHYVALLSVTTRLCKMTAGTA